MNIRDAYSAKAIALVNNEVASNKQPYLGEGLFPATKKMGLDLKLIKTNKGLPVSLAPSNFDAVSAIRSREGIEIMNTEMAYFKESMLVSEKDEQDMLRVQESSDPYAQDVLNRIFDDANTLVAGADVVPERMRMQLLNPTNGVPAISIVGTDGVTYAYNYDPDGSWGANNYNELLTKKWDDPTTSDPLADVEAAQSAVQEVSGSIPTKMIVSKKTMNLIKKSDSIKNAILAQNVTANVMITDARVKELFSEELGINIIVYTKMFKDEAGNAQKFFADGFAALIPDGTLGKTFYGTTPSERTAMASPDADVSIVNTGVAIEVLTTHDPENTKTVVSEIVLPSFDRLDEVFVIKAY